MVNTMAESLSVVLDPFSGAMGAAVGAIIMFLVVLFLAYYIFNSLAMVAIAKKIGTKNPWLAWIPIANIYLMTQMVGISGWWTFGILAVFVPFIGGPLVLAGTIYLYWIIAEKVERPGWFAILLIIPIVNLVILGMMAWGTPDGKAPQHQKTAEKKAVSRKPVKKKGFKKK